MPTCAPRTTCASHDDEMAWGILLLAGNSAVGTTGARTSYYCCASYAGDPVGDDYSYDSDAGNPPLRTPVGGRLHEPRLTTTTPRLTASHTRCLARQPSREPSATPSLMPRSAKPVGDADVGRVVRAEAADDAIAREDVTRAPLDGRHASDCTSRFIQSRRGAPRAGALLPSSLSIVAACTFPRSSSNALL